MSADRGDLETALAQVVEAASWAETMEHGRVGHDIAEAVLGVALAQVGPDGEPLLCWRASMTDDLPQSAVDAGETWLLSQAGKVIGTPQYVTGVLLAASEIIDCPTCEGRGHDDYRDPNGEPNPNFCPGCRGTGRLRVIR